MSLWEPKHMPTRLPLSPIIIIHTQLHGRTVGSDNRRRWIETKAAGELDQQRHEPAHEGRPHVRAVDVPRMVVRHVQQRHSLARRNTRGGLSITQESTSILT